MYLIQVELQNYVTGVSYQYEMTLCFVEAEQK